MARFVAVASIFFTALVLVLLGSWAAIEVINVTRAYVAGEGLYSKSQKSAVVALHRYAAEGDAADYREFLAAIAVPLGDNAARRALEGPEPDFAAAEDGFLRGRNTPSDIWGLSRFFVWLSDWGPFARAVEDWRTAEPLIDELRLIGAAMEVAPHGIDGAGARAALLVRADMLDRRLTVLEDSFSHNVGAAARAARDLLLLLLGLGGALLWIAATLLIWRSHRTGVIAERRLAASRRRFQDFAEVASDWFWEMDASLRLSYISPRFADATGIAVGQVVGRTRTSLAGGDVDEPHWRQHLDDLQARRPFHDFVYRVDRAASGEQYWSVSGRPLFDRSGAFIGYRGTGNNVTATVAAQREMLAARKAAEFANRTKSAFLANMSHELRTPLNSIMGFSELLTDAPGAPARNPRDAEYAGFIHDAARHLLNIINDILDLSKIEAGKAELREEPVELAAVVHAVHRLTRERAVRGDLRFEVALADDLPLVIADERALKQILMNLVSNAIKFTPPGGRVRIEGAIDPAGDLVLSVDDTGIGMAEADLPTALAPFGQIDSSLSRQYEGTGLGLPLSKSLAELHQGRLEIVTAVGRGTRVSIRLPAARVVRDAQSADARSNAT